MISCKGICTRFLAQLNRVKGNYGEGKWSGRKVSYDWKTYNRRVVKNPTSVINDFSYGRCKSCEIFLAREVFFSSGINRCLCCNGQLSYRRDSVITKNGND